MTKSFPFRKLAGSVSVSLIGYTLVNSIDSTFMGVACRDMNDESSNH